MRYRVTVERESQPEDDKGYARYVEVYQQIVEDLDVPELAVHINMGVTKQRLIEATQLYTKDDGCPF